MSVRGIGLVRGRVRRADRRRRRRSASSRCRSSRRFTPLYVSIGAPSARRGVRGRRARPIAPAGRRGVNTRTRLAPRRARCWSSPPARPGGGRQAAARTSAPSTGGPPAVAIPHVAPGGAPTLRAAIAKLCVPPGQTERDGRPGRARFLPTLVAIAHQVERARGHTFTHLPPATAVSDQEMNRRLLKSFSSTYPRSVYDRRTVAWRTIGVIGPGDDLYRAYRSFPTGQVVGYYDPETGELVYLELGRPRVLGAVHAGARADARARRPDLRPDAARPLERALPRRAGRGGARARWRAAPSTTRRSRSPRTRRSTSPTCSQALAQSASGDSPPPGVPRVRVRPAALALHGGGGVRRLARRPAARRPWTTPSSTSRSRPSRSSIPRRYPVGPPAAGVDPGPGRRARVPVGRPRRDDDRRAVAPDMLALRDGVSPDAATGWGGGGYRAFTDGTQRGGRPAHAVGPAGPGRHVRLGAAGLGRRPRALPRRWCTPAPR